jgi:hypothetical protein
MSQVKQRKNLSIQTKNISNTSNTSNTSNVDKQEKINNEKQNEQNNETDEEYNELGIKLQSTTLFQIFYSLFKPLLFITILLFYIHYFFFSSIPSIEPISYESILPNITYNTYLEQSTKHGLFNNIIGPETIIFKNNDLFTGLYDGRIVRINVDSFNKKNLDVETIVYIGIKK